MSSWCSVSCQWVQTFVSSRSLTLGVLLLVHLFRRTSLRQGNRIPVLVVLRLCIPRLVLLILGLEWEKEGRLKEGLEDDSTWMDLLEPIQYRNYISTSTSRTWVSPRPSPVTLRLLRFSSGDGTSVHLNGLTIGYGFTLTYTWIVDPKIWCTSTYRFYFCLLKIEFSKRNYFTHEWFWIN